MTAQRGFTLIELMITVVIISILAAIAYPSYQQYILRGNRAEGQALLNDAAARQERYFAQNNAYTNDLSKLNMRNSSGSGTTATVQSDTGLYALTLSTTAANSGGYLLTATPRKAPQTSDSKCTTLTLNALGTKGSSGSAAAADCWK
ncbi:type IV pilus assembly protein PilE [Pseudomonas nitritireducens]|uniref:Type IV pilus assembly protein PilE n=1 Tax=Pseudomonas nitroreducens TaxID=46680 RepID=A0A7W7P1T2_PSENT|nr:type IV pilin protein [Pseudomonas nitritireducens]MBB4865163.1 type IV pilus assembly protein PilE [Pseudomonas nitritireducens]